MRILLGADGGGVATLRTGDRRQRAGPDGHGVDDLEEGTRIERAVVIGVEVGSVGRRQAAQQHVRHVVGVFEIEVGDEVGRGGGHARFTDEQVAIGGNGLAGQVHEGLDHAAALRRRAVADDDEPEAVERCTGRALELDVFIVVGTGLVDADLVEADGAVVLGGVRGTDAHGRREGEREGHGTRQQQAGRVLQERDGREQDGHEDPQASDAEPAATGAARRGPTYDPRRRHSRNPLEVRCGPCRLLATVNRDGCLE